MALCNTLPQSTRPGAAPGPARARARRRVRAPGSHAQSRGTERVGRSKCSTYSFARARGARLRQYLPWAVPHPGTNRALRRLTSEASWSLALPSRVQARMLHMLSAGVGRGACGRVVACVAFVVPATLGSLLRASVALVVTTSLASRLVRRQGWRRFARAAFPAEFASLRRAAAWKFHRYLCRAVRVAGGLVWARPPGMSWARLMCLSGRCFPWQ